MIIILRGIRPSTQPGAIHSTDSDSSVPDGAYSTVNESPVFELTVPRHNVTARAQEIDGEFTVLEGSLARAERVGTSRHPGYQQMHDRFIADGTLQPLEPDLARFTRSVAFDSPSAAGAVVTGRACNGRTSWISVVDGSTFGAWQSRGIDTTAEVAEVAE